MIKRLLDKKILLTGMTLAEVMVAIAILSVMMFSIAGAISLVFKANRYDRDLTTSITFSQDVLEQIRTVVSETAEPGVFDKLLYIPPPSATPTYRFLALDIQNLIYNVECMPVPPGSDPNTRLNDIRQVKVTVWYYNQASSKNNPQPSGVKLYQISTYIRRRN
ncbi:MAG TPA: prepilin-type N-terminal cleavage/methylation domain-containing protein [Candidatus Eremiobacteraeota bacterium]|nr:MAG: hypothetical protein BWY64_03820 [bacterium ADurb.Bin363]HPZ09806.1 prepilin-type N-terminal cleavage/methylation domain-containing protein [Candidatus Eremiobacteraeota bacterium]